MPIYFNDVAPFCPVSRDQPTGPSAAPAIRTVVPRAHDLASAIAAVNMLRSIISQIVTARTINNVYASAAPRPRKDPVDRVIDKRRYTRWVEEKSKRVKRRYKYYGKVEGSTSGEEDRDTWVMTERIERMVWYDTGWKTRVEFRYGDKGEGEPVPPTAVAAASEE